MLDFLKDKLYFRFVAHFSTWAKIVLKRSGAKIIIVTGSAGKTGNMALLLSVLDNAKVSYKFAQQANSALGIPLSILGLSNMDVNSVVKKSILWFMAFWQAPFISFASKKESFKYYVFEVDSDRPGEMVRSIGLLEPDYVIWNNVGITHSVFHDSKVAKDKIQDSITKEFAQSILQMKSTGVAILNTDDQEIARYVKSAKGKVISDSKNDGLLLETYDTTNYKTKCVIKINKDKLGGLDSSNWPDEVIINIERYLLPDFYYYTFSSVLVFCLIFGISYDVYMNALQNFSLPGGRMSLFNGVNDTRIIDSSYNSSRSAAIGAIDLLSRYENNIAILGDMRELGDETKEEHELLMQEIIDKNIDRVILVGVEMNKYALPYLESHGFAKDKVYSFIKTKELKDKLENNLDSLIQYGSTILIKGSQNTIFLEIIVEVLLKNKDDIKYLTRRGIVWDERREEILA